ncbi:MAG TPA: ribokinase [Rectinemataceae bacterium]|nr:ribokinase [Rectinemataceae bacterium]
MNRFCIVGSLNMDMVTRMERFLRPGETMRGSSFTIFPGGKGANQAVALAKLGAKVEMVGAVGDEVLGHRYEEVLSGLGVGMSGLARVPGVSTGTASIEVTVTGENHIIVVAGANDRVTPDYVESKREIIEGCDILLLQLEIPIESVIAAARIAARAGARVLLDPAPARELPSELYPLVSIVTPNETEAHILTGEDTETDEGIARAGAALVARGIRSAVIKAGGRGAFLAESDGCARIPGFKVKVVDTVAAGDSFNAGLAFALGRGASLAEAIRFANAVGALSTTREGAQSAMPSLAEAEALSRL